jgi:serine/threonine protein kinase
VVVKRLYQDNSRRVKQFINKVNLFLTLNHPCVVCLYGCVYEDSLDILFIYEFVPNGILVDHLHGHHKGPKGLPRDTRFSIAIQTAYDLDFLHFLDLPIFHKDVKYSNIILDEDFNVKVASCGGLRCP